MLCKHPYAIAAGVRVGCGRCMTCRINRRREWTGRQVLESYCHDSSIFITLTYDQENEPENRSLKREHLTKWIKKMKNDISSLGLPQFRYFAVGEYGEKNERPHYHVNAFGLGREWHKHIETTWPYGFVGVEDFTPQRAQYVVKYAVKAMNWRGDQRLRGRYPEFSTMSKHPAIGVPALPQILKAMESQPQAELPLEFRVNGKKFPFGRVLRNKMYEMSGRENEKAISTQIWINEQQAELLPLLEIEIAESKIASTSKISARLGEGKRLSVEARAKIYGQQRSEL